MKRTIAVIGCGRISKTHFPVLAQIEGLKVKYACDLIEEKAQAAAKAIFAGGGNSDNMPSTTLAADDFSEDGLNIIDAMIKAGLVTSRGEARRLIEQGGVSVDDVKITVPAYIIPLSDFEKGYVIIKKGKKVFHKIIK